VWGIAGNDEQRHPVTAVGFLRADDQRLGDLGELLHDVMDNGMDGMGRVTTSSPDPG